MARRQLLILLALAGCYDISGLQTPAMTPGQDCMVCHNANGTASARVWAVAGTAFADPQAEPDAGLLNAEILIMDSAGTELTLRANEVGNFYTAEALVPPLHVEAQWGDHRMRMVEPPPTGSCNSCHTLPQVSVAGFPPAPGRLFVPTGNLHGYCGVCATSADCNLGGVCIKLPNGGGAICGSPCQGASQQCPTGAVCVTTTDGNGVDAGPNCLPASGSCGG